jgi:hypothetical protein
MSSPTTLEQAFAAESKAHESGEEALQEPLLPPTPNAIPEAQASAVVTAFDAEEAQNLLHASDTTSQWEQHGQVQSKACRDWIWGIFFLLQLAVVMVLAVMGVINLVREGSEWLPYNDDDNTHPKDDDTNGGGDANLINGAGILFFVTLLSVVIVISAVLLKVLLGTLAQMMIQISLVLSPLSFGLTFVVALVTFNIPLAFFALFMSAFGVFYAWGVWHRIPFATANIEVAMKALDANHGLWILAYAVTFKAYIWTLVWVCTFLQIFVYSPTWVYNCKHYDDDPSQDTCRLSTRGKWIALACLLSLFWTAQVLKNIFHTTIAGVVGTWWFDPVDAQSTSALEAAPGSSDSGNDNSRSSCCCTCCGCTPAILDSIVRSSWYSFGSICLGSLLVGLLQVLQFLVRCGRQQRDQHRQQDRARSPQAGDLCCCLLQFVVDNLEFLMRYFNQWAFVYVGLYGYNYVTAGKQVSALFQDRGWSNIINDHLVGRSLGMMSVLISLITGILGTLIGFVFLGPLGALPTFVLGMVLGGMSCTILFGVVISAVNTIVVCFAEAPNELLRNHPPALFQTLVESWRVAYPQECGF